MSIIYGTYKQAMAQDNAQATNFETTDVKAYLVSSAVNAADKYVSDLTGIVSTSPNLLTKAVNVSGVYSAANWTWTAVSGATVVGVVFALDSGNPATSLLMTYLDSTHVTGLPLPPNGGDVNWIGDPAGLWGL